MHLWYAPDTVHSLISDVTMGKKDDFVSRWKKSENRAVAQLDKLYEQYMTVK